MSVRHAGPVVLELEVDAAGDEVSTLNNHTAVVVNGVRERLRVLLVSGQPHPGERTWRNLLKSDPSVDLVHFTILRPPEKDDGTPLKELSLIVFPVQELFETKLADFDLVVFDRYVVRGLLPTPYYARIAEYVRQGGALLVAIGPEFAGGQSLFRTPLGDVLPIRPTDRVFEQAFRPRITDVGQRHPISSGLPGETVAGDADLAEPSSGPTWGRWFRLIEGEAQKGTTLMTGIEGRPLLVVDRVGEGRVAQLMSDHIWLWARGLEGGGPHVEILRRLAHWLMKEPELEEEHLQGRVIDGRLLVERRSLSPGNVDVTVTDPSGHSRGLTLEDGHDGLARGEVKAEEAGLWRISDGVRTAFAAAGRIDPPELTDFRATPERLSPLIELTGGGTAWIEDGIPEFRRTPAGRDAAGRRLVRHAAQRRLYCQRTRRGPAAAGDNPVGRGFGRLRRRLVARRSMNVPLAKNYVRPALFTKTEAGGKTSWPLGSCSLIARAWRRRPFLRRPLFAHEWVEYATTSPEQVLDRRSGDTEIAITNKVPLRGEVLAQLLHLRLIAVAATGTDVVVSATVASTGSPCRTFAATP